MKRERLMLAVIAGGYLLTMFEIRHLHRYVISEDWWGWIPLGYCLFAVGACALGMAASARVRWVAISIFLLGLVVGPMGLWRHSEGKPVASVEKMVRQIKEANTDDDDPKPDGAPLLAPLGITGLSVIGAILLWPARRIRS